MSTQAALLEPENPIGLVWSIPAEKLIVDETPRYRPGPVVLADRQAVYVDPTSRPASITF